MTSQRGGRSLPRGFPFNGQLNFSGVAHFFIPASRGYTWSIHFELEQFGKACLIVQIAGVSLRYFS